MPSNWFLDKYRMPGSVVTIETGFWTPEQGAKIIKEIKALAKKESVIIAANLDLGIVDEEKMKDLAKKMEDAGANMIEAICPCPIITPSKEGVDVWYQENPTKIIKVLKGAVNIRFPENA